MRIAAIYLGRQDGRAGREAWELAYPLAYRAQIENLAEQEQLPSYLIFAAVREESFFNPEVKSSAGAIGLMQLMPTTAEYIARQLKMPNFDLNNPDHNLTLGCSYLGCSF